METKVYGSITITDVTDGKQFYTWIMYADDANGANMSEDSTNKAYIGHAYNQTEPTPNTEDPTLYEWALFANREIEKTPLYYVSTSDVEYPEISDASMASGYWKDEFPTSWSSENYIWTTTRIKWANEDITYSPNPATLISQIEAATLSAQLSGKSLGEWCALNKVTIINGSTIMTGSIDADRLDVNELSAITGNMGLLEAGAIQSKDYNGPSIWADDFLSVGLEYIDNYNDGYDLVDIGTCTDKNLVIPSTYNGKMVVCIDSEAFYNCNQLVGVTIQDGVKEIREYAFCGCGNLISVTMPNSIIAIGNGAFCSCYSLKSVKIPNNVLSIGDYTFSECHSLTNIEIPNIATSIGEYAFDSCSGLTSVTIPDSVTSIGECAFGNCSNLKSVIIGQGVSIIGDDIFGGCDKLQRIYYKGDKGSWENLGVTIPSNATVYYYSETKPTTSGNYWHYNDDGFRISCDDMMIDSKYFQVTSDGKISAREVNLIGSMTAAEGAIGNCKIDPDGAITSANGNFTVDKDGDLTARNASITGHIKSENYARANNLVAWHDETICIDTSNGPTGGLMYSQPYRDGSVEVVGIGTATDTDIVIPETDAEGHRVCGIAVNAFRNNTVITSVTFLGDVDFIDFNAFSDCTNLKYVYLPDTVTVEAGAFSGCNNLMYFFSTIDETDTSKHDEYLDAGMACKTATAQASTGMCTVIKNSTQLVDNNQYLHTYNGSTQWLSISLKPMTSSCLINGIQLTDSSQQVYRAESNNGTIGQTVTITMYAYVNAGENKVYFQYQVGVQEITNSSSATSTQKISTQGHQQNVTYSYVPLLYYSKEPTSDGNHWYCRAISHSGWKISSDINDDMIDSEYFRVSSDGEIYAQNAYIDGRGMFSKVSAVELFVDDKFIVNEANAETMNCSTVNGSTINTDSINFQDGAYCLTSYYSNDVDIATATLSSSADIGSRPGAMIVTLTKSDGGPYVTGKDMVFPVAVPYENSWEGNGTALVNVTVLAGQSTGKRNVSTGSTLWAAYDELKDYNFTTIANGKTYTFQIGGECSGLMVNGDFFPSDNGEYELGIDGKAWKSIYYTTDKGSSDRKIKDNIAQLDDTFCKELITNLSPKSFTFKTAKTPRTRYGFIAQEVEGVLNNLGYTTDDVGLVSKLYPDKADCEDNFYSLSYINLIAPLVNVVQQLNRRVEELESQLKTRQNDSKES